MSRIYRYCCYCSDYVNLVKPPLHEAIREMHVFTSFGKVREWGLKQKGGATRTPRSALDGFPEPAIYKSGSGRIGSWTGEDNQ